MQKVIGLTGSFGSGCTTIAGHLAKNGYSKISISANILSELASKYKEKFSTREDKQLFGNEVRLNHKEEYENVLLDTVREAGEKVVIECLRNPIEISLFRDNFPHFYLFAIFANKRERKLREQRKQRNGEGIFEDCDKRDEGEKDDFGQQVRKCVNQADIVLDNSSNWRHGDDANEFFYKVMTHIELIDIPNRPPSHEETNMHLAYSLSLHSSCIQRQVGAVITDREYRVLSVGYNDVPRNSESCFDLNSQCSRKIKDKENIINACKELIRNCPFCGKDLNFKDDLFSTDPKNLLDEAFLCNTCKRDLSVIFKSRNLDYCRSLHAEENAILSNPFLADKSREDRGMIIFSTSFPCML